jgi:hypothetical protein
MMASQTPPPRSSTSTYGPIFSGFSDLEPFGPEHPDHPDHPDHDPTPNEKQPMAAIAPLDISEYGRSPEPHFEHDGPRPIRVHDHSDVRIQGPYSRSLRGPAVGQAGSYFGRDRPKPKRVYPADATVEPTKPRKGMVATWNMVRGLLKFKGGKRGGDRAFGGRQRGLLGLRRKFA